MGDLISINIDMPRTRRYHLLLGYGGDAASFNELVDASDSMREDGGWFGTADRPMVVSSVEADARLARWTRSTGGLGLRISRTDPTRIWMAVHHAGERLVALVHHHGSEMTEPQTGLIVDPDIGRDPLLDLLRDAGSSRDDVRKLVAQRRSQQLADALAVGSVNVNADAIAHVLFDNDRAGGGMDGLLTLLGCGNLIQLTRSLGDEPDPGQSLQSSVQKTVVSALLSGCIAPALIGTGAFVFLTRWAAKLGLPPSLALIAGMGGAWATMSLVRKALTRRGATGYQWHQRMMLAWAAEFPVGLTRPIRPTAAALDTWGGLFYLLRDIAFFGGIDRPQGPMALYVEAWCMGPPGLVESINEAEAKDADRSRLYDVASGLVALRGQLIDDHLAGAKIAPQTVTERVHNILRPITKDRSTGPGEAR